LRLGVTPRMSQRRSMLRKWKFLCVIEPICTRPTVSGKRLGMTYLKLRTHGFLGTSSSSSAAVQVRAATEAAMPATSACAFSQRIRSRVPETDTSLGSESLSTRPRSLRRAPSQRPENLETFKLSLARLADSAKSLNLLPKATAAPWEASTLSLEKS